MENDQVMSSVSNVIAPQIHQMPQIPPMEQMELLKNLGKISTLLQSNSLDDVFKKLTSDKEMLVVAGNLLKNSLSFGKRRKMRRKSRKMRRRSRKMRRRSRRSRHHN